MRQNQVFRQVEDLRDWARADFALPELEWLRAKRSSYQAAQHSCLRSIAGPIQMCNMHAYCTKPEGAYSRRAVTTMGPLRRIK